jgi:hypothetical protein
VEVSFTVSCPAAALSGHQYGLAPLSGRHRKFKGVSCSAYGAGNVEKPPAWVRGQRTDARGWHCTAVSAPLLESIEYSDTVPFGVCRKPFTWLVT